MFENEFIKYYIRYKTCVVVYKPGKITPEIGEILIKKKEKLQGICNMTRFVGVINWSEVSMKGLKMSQFTSEKALNNVTHIGVVHLTNKCYLKQFYILGSKLLNWLIPLVQTKGIEIKFFTDINESINWSNGNL